MTTLIDKLLANYSLEGFTVVAASALYANDDVGDRAISLPRGYTNEQRAVFEDTINTIPENTLTWSTIWLDNYGFFEYNPDDMEWVYYPPAPSIPNFPNNQQLDCLYNAVVDAHYGLNKDKPIIEYTSTERGDGLFDAVIKIKGRNKEQVRALANELVKDAEALGITGARINIDEE